MVTVYTWHQINNNTFVDVVNTHVPTESMDSFDWTGGVDRPDFNLSGREIKAGESINEREEVTWAASNSPFTMELHFEDGSSDHYRLNQKNGYDWNVGNLDFRDYEGSDHILSAWREERTIYVSIKNTPAQIKNHRAEELEKESEKDIDVHKYNEALKKLEEAAGLANQDETIEKINTKLAQVHDLIGKESQEKGDTLEADGKTKEAQKLYEQARDHYRAAQNAKYTEEYVSHVKAIEAKIAGNMSINKGVEVEAEGEELYNKHIAANVSNSFEDVEKKYEEALAKYEEGLKKFEEGAKNVKAWFGSRLGMVKSQIQQIEGAIFSVLKNALIHNVALMHDKEKEDEEDDEDDEEEPDVVQVIDA